MKQTEVIVIGSGQAGLAISYYLMKQRREFLILDASRRIGDQWRHRYDSLCLFTPRMYSQLPGFPFEGEPHGLPSKDEAADYLERYAEHFSFPLQLNTQVHQLQQHHEGFVVETDQGDYWARQVIVATGPFQKPMLPPYSEQLSEQVYQVHSSGYQNSKLLNPGPVVIVGAGNSGAQIAVELANERQVTIAAGHPLTFKPLHLMGKSIFWYFNQLGLIQADHHSMRGKWVKRQTEHIYGLELKRMIRDQKVLKKTRVISAEGCSLYFEDGSAAEAQNVIWATGFRTDYSWIRVPGALDSNGKPNHNRGVSQVEGLYYIGMPWQTCRGSALMGWVGMDAAFISDCMKTRSS